MRPDEHDCAKMEEDFAYVRHERDAALKRAEEAENNLADALDLKHGGAPTVLQALVDQRDSLRAELAQVRAELEKQREAFDDLAKISIQKGGAILSQRRHLEDRCAQLAAAQAEIERLKAQLKTIPVKCQCGTVKTCEFGFDPMANCVVCGAPDPRIAAASAPLLDAVKLAVDVLQDCRNGFKLNDADAHHIDEALARLRKWVGE